MEQNTTNKPLRRVGTLTLGVCLIAAGTLFLLARFLPGLPWLVIWQVLPAAGCRLGGAAYSSCSWSKSSSVTSFSFTTGPESRGAFSGCAASSA